MTGKRQREGNHIGRAPKRALLNGRALVQTTLGAFRTGRRIGTAVAKAWKKWRSFTKKRRLRRKLISNVWRPADGHGTFGHFYLRSRVKRDTWRVLKNIGEKRHYTNGYGRIFDDNTGQQCVGQLALLDGNTLYNIVNDYNDQTPVSSDHHTVKSYLTHWKTKITFSNMHTMGSKVRIYLVVPRHDYTGTSGSGGTPLNSWQLGLNDELGSSAINKTVYLEQSPLRSKQFCKEWKVIKTYDWFMKAGDEHTHTFRLKGIKPIDLYWLKRYNAAGTFATPGSCKNTTIWMLVTVNGQVVWDVTNAKATTGNANLCYVVTHEYGHKRILNDGYVDENMTDLLSHVAGTTSKFIETDEAAVVAPEQP